jgi:hypothetical protein
LLVVDKPAFVEQWVNKTDLGGIPNLKRKPSVLIKFEKAFYKLVSKRNRTPAAEKTPARHLRGVMVSKE